MNVTGIIAVILVTVLPELLVLGLLGISTLISWRARSLLHSCATVAIFISMFWSLLVWYQIYFLQALRVSCSPLILNGAAAGFFAAQMIGLARHDNVA
jgi:hypothetical protein